MEKPTLEISQPRRFGVVSILGKYAFSLLPAIPVLVAILLISLKNLGLWSLVIPLLALAGMIYILPFFGNAYVSWIVRGTKQGGSESRDQLIVQITLCPRIRAGIRALIEDADDIGYLSLNESGLLFSGDAVKLMIPFERIRAVEGENVGLRGLYVSAGRIRLAVSGLEGFEAVEIAERGSRVLPTSRKVTRELFYRLKSRLDQ
jgi:hypothetical protein